MGTEMGFVGIAEGSMVGMLVEGSSMDCLVVGSWDMGCGLVVLGRNIVAALQGR